MEAVVVVDIGDETISEEAIFMDWFKNNDCMIDEDNIIVMQETNEEHINYTHFGKAKTIIFKFETDGVYFPPVLIQFIENLKDMKDTQISVAEEGLYGEYTTLVDMTLKQFIENVVNGDEEE